MKARPPYLAAPLLSAAWLLLSGTAAQAQEIFDRPNTPTLEFPGFAPRDNRDTFSLPPVPPPAAEPAPPAGHAAETRTLRVDRVAFIGNTAMSSTELEAIAADYIGRPLTADDIESLRQKLTRHHIDAGYINSGAILAPEALQNGTLTFRIVEGRLSTLRLKGLQGLNERYVSARLVPDEDAPLNIDALRDRFQLLLADPLFKRAQARIIPDTAPGQAVLDIAFERARPYQLEAFAGNRRVASIGEYAVGASGWIRNLSGWGDTLDLSLQTDAEGKGGTRYALGWSIPVNARGTHISLRIDNSQANVVEDPGPALDIRSRQQNTEIGLHHRLVDTLGRRFAIGIDRNWRKSKSYLLGEPFSFNPGETDGSTRIDGWRYWLEYTRRSEHDAFIARGTLISNRSNLDATPDAPDRNNRITLLQAHYARRLNDSGLQLSLRGTLQDTGQRLSPLDRMAIGGMESVRGFRENQLLRDNGGTLNIDLDYPLNIGRDIVEQLSVGLFHDRGAGRNQHESWQHLHASGLTLKARAGPWHFSLAAAFSRKFPEGSERRSDTLQDRGIHFTISHAFFD